MNWQNYLRKLEDKIIEKKEHEELAAKEEIEKIRDKYEKRTQIVKNIFPRIEKVFNEFAKTIRLNKKWKNVTVEKRVEKTTAWIGITRKFQVGGGGFEEAIVIKLFDYVHFSDSIAIYRRTTNNEKHLHIIPEELLIKYREYEEYYNPNRNDICQTFIAVNDFNEEKLAQVLADFFNP
jgi:DNA gyrase/topoisomerase IV subunit A